MVTSELTSWISFFTIIPLVVLMYAQLVQVTVNSPISSNPPLFINFDVNHPSRISSNKLCNDLLFSDFLSNFEISAQDCYIFVKGSNEASITFNSSNRRFTYLKSETLEQDILSESLKLCRKGAFELSIAIIAFYERKAPISLEKRLEIS